MKVYVTKYALTKGIFLVDGEIYDDTGFQYRDGYRSVCLRREEFSLTLPLALEQAEKRRRDKLVSLQKSIDKLKVKAIKVRQ